ncbi:MAG: diguanylate cyclase/phosphodiesterase with sensor [Frankiales bacterium]|nr:diguanylate cyclase/phosphodiesterase with sensor [Frankiales bacterium]
MIDSPRLVHGLAELSRAATAPFAVADMLRELCLLAGEILDVAGAGVLRIDGSSTQFVSTSHPRLETTERLQESLAACPCVDSARDGQVVIVNNMYRDNLWPEYAEHAIRNGLLAVVSVPLRSRDRTWGVLNLYRDEVTQWRREELDAISLLADIAVSYIVMAADRDAAVASEAELAHRWLHDQLTGLPNRGLLFDRIDHAVATAQRHGAAVALFFLDLDHFKAINDGYGHAVGDAVLVEVARRMTLTLREGDTLARLAGDEFVLLCEDLPSADAVLLNALALRIAARVHQALAEPFRIPHNGGTAELMLSTSIGVALVVDEWPSAPDLLQDADAAMYAAKALGAGRVVVAEHDAEDRPRDSGLRRDLAHAMDNNELRVFYQPIIASDGHTHGVEALLRWLHPEHGLLDAGAFIDLAESSGRLPMIGRWVVDRVTLQLAQWRRQLSDDAPHIAFCNFSSTELFDARLASEIRIALSRNGLLPSDLGLEVLEGSLIALQLVPVLIGYQQRGHALSVDDFGTGYSSLSRLVQLPVSYAKIDRAFVAQLPGDERSRTLVDAIVLVARKLNLKIIAEGIENGDQLAYLRSAGCDYFQGYFIQRPAPPDQLFVEA